MNLYSSIDDIKQKLGTNKNILLDDIEDKMLENIIEEQSRIVDDFIRSAESVPYDDISSPDQNPCPKIIKNLTETFVIKYLYSRLSFKDIPDYIQKDYENATKILEKIQKGIISIGANPSISQPDSGGANESFRWTSKPKVFTKEL